MFIKLYRHSICKKACIIKFKKNKFYKQNIERMTYCYIAKSLQIVNYIIFFLINYFYSIPTSSFWLTKFFTYDFI